MTLVRMQTNIVCMRTNLKRKKVTYLTLIKQLAEAYQAFERYSASHVRELGLTPTQFDILATLGNQRPMTCKELGEKTLIMKGTMTGVLDRLTIKGLIDRLPNEEDARSYKIELSLSGKALFEKAFPNHLEHLKHAFSKMTQSEISESIRVLKSIESIF